MDAETLEILLDFITESRDILLEVEPLLIELEQSSEGIPDPEMMNKIFRLVHSMKGVAGFLQLDHVAKVTHHGETLLDKLRKGTIPMGPAHVDVLIKTLDILGQMLNKVEADHSDENCTPEAERALGILAAADAQDDAQDDVQDDAQDAAPAEEAPAAQAPEVIAAPAPPLAPPPAAADTQPMNISADNIGDAVMAAVNAQDPNKVGAVIDLGPSDPGTRNTLPPSIEPHTGGEAFTDEMVGQFRQESSELLDTFEEALLSAETADDKSQSVAIAFRAIHSFKGNCGFFGYAQMERVTHRMETVLEGVKENTLPATSAVFGALLNVIDKLRAALDGIPAGQGAVRDFDQISANLEQLLENPVAIAPVAAPAPAAPPAPVAVVAPAPVAAPAPVTVAAKPVAAKRPPPAQPAAPRAQSASSDSGGKGKAQASIRVDLDKLDNLINMVGELIIAEATVTHNPDLDNLDIPNFSKAAQRLNRITRSLHDIAMSVRMVPVATTFRRMIRLARDLSQKQGKPVELKISGEDTEVDKTVIEQIGDPLVHIIRNAIDHGVESPEDRVAAGKPAKSIVQLNAKHHGGEVWIQVIDDGKGLPRERILEKARARGLVEERAELKDSEVFALIFEPGFSTAEQVTDVSGRGVGMDVVKRNIEKLKGRVEVTSKPGEGSVFTLRIPLTLAIIDGMLVRVGETFYTIPLLAIRESFRSKEEDITILADGQEVVRIRESLYPIIRIHRLHAIPHDYQNIEDGILMVLEDKGEELCIFVDEVLGQRQTVIKALSDILGNLRGLSGCSILGNGDISLILDVNNLLESVRSVDVSKEAAVIATAGGEARTPQAPASA